MAPFDFILDAKSTHASAGTQLSSSPVNKWIGESEKSNTSGSIEIFLKVIMPFAKTDAKIKFDVPVTLTLGKLYWPLLFPFFATDV